MVNILKIGVRLHRLSNLRVCNHHVNMVNRSMQGNNKSGTIGVSWLEGRQKWRARIVVNKKSIDLGFFTTKEQAIVARKLGEVTYGYDQLRYQPEQVRMVAEAAWGITLPGQEVATDD